MHTCSVQILLNTLLMKLFILTLPQIKQSYLCAKIVKFLMRSIIYRNDLDIG